MWCDFCIWGDLEKHRIWVCGWNRLENGSSEPMEIFNWVCLLAIDTGNDWKGSMQVRSWLYRVFGYLGFTGHRTKESQSRGMVMYEYGRDLRVSETMRTRPERCCIFDKKTNPGVVCHKESLWQHPLQLPPHGGWRAAPLIVAENSIHQKAQMTSCQMPVPQEIQRIVLWCYSLP